VPDAASARFAGTIEEQPGAVVLTLVGELDMTTAVAARNAADHARFRARKAGAPLLVFDLTQVTFLASIGLSILVVQHRRAEADGIPLRVVVASRRVSRPIELTALDTIIAQYPTLTAALTS
jgi:anti-sigma B factor antagonist